MIMRVFTAHVHNKSLRTILEIKHISYPVLFALEAKGYITYQKPRGKLLLVIVIWSSMNEKTTSHKKKAPKSH